MLDQKAILNQCKKYEKEMVNFMCEMIKIPSESCQEKEVIQCIKKEMEKVGFDKVFIDKMGNIFGKIGNGKRIIAMDAHIDTVGVGSMTEWKKVKREPFKPVVKNGIIYGRGASDQEAAMISMVYAGKVIKDLNLTDDYTLYIVGSVQEEDCDGLCWQYILNEKVIPRPECVLITEPTNLDLYRGHRGRMEIGVTTFGKSCHGSAPERGKNAVYMMARVALEIEKLNERLKNNVKTANQKFLGKGTVTISHISSKSPSLCAVTGEAYIHLDRRLTLGETEKSAVAEIKDACKRAGLKPNEFKVEVLTYDTPSYTGLKYPTKKYYPTWLLEENHPLCKAGLETYKTIFNKKPELKKWVFSTNGVAIMGMHKVPCLGFGPANEIHAHQVEDQVPIAHLVKAAAFYAAFPKVYCKTTKKTK
ncbi:MAG TPA: YgeY family selenium metabolism-linked hydrolase [bacterium]|nr:YgeY family selenium metabolism-linked hydrolase [bacterium]